MDEKLLQELIDKWNDTDKSIPFYEWMYYQGCAAQAEADWAAIKELHEKPHGVIASDAVKKRVLAALTAATIKEK